MIFFFQTGNSSVCLVRASQAAKMFLEVIAPLCKANNGTAGTYGPAGIGEPINKNKVIRTSLILRRL